MQQETGGRGDPGGGNDSSEEQPPLDLRFRLEDHTYMYQYDTPVIIGYARDLPTMHSRMAIADPDGRLELKVIDRETEEVIPGGLIWIAVRNAIHAENHLPILSHKVDWAKEGF